MTTPRIGIPELPTGSNASPEIMNEALRHVEQGASLFIVKDKDQNDPPGSPVDGDCYIVAGSPTGAWTGWATRLAFYMSTSWVDITPIEGTTAYVQDENAVYRYDGAAWGIVADAAAEATASEIWAASSTTKFVSPDKLMDAAAPAVLTSSATVTPNGNNGFNFTLLLGHNATLANPSNFNVGQSGVIVITQDTGEPWTLAYGSNWKFPGGAPVLSTAAGAVDAVSYYVVTSSFYVCTLIKAFSS